MLHVMKVVLLQRPPRSQARTVERVGVVDATAMTVDENQDVIRPLCRNHHAVRVASTCEQAK